MRVLVIGLKRELPLSPADSLDIADRLVARAASAHTDGLCVCVSQPCILHSVPPTSHAHSHTHTNTHTRHPQAAGGRKKGTVQRHI